MGLPRQTWGAEGHSTKGSTEGQQEGFPWLRTKQCVREQGPQARRPGKLLESSGPILGVAGRRQLPCIRTPGGHKKLCRTPSRGWQEGG